MPIHINPPDWLSDEYLAKAKPVLSQLRELPSRMDERKALAELWKGVDWPYPNVAINMETVEWGGAGNRVERDLYESRAEIYRLIFPSAAINAIEMHEIKPTLAERSELPLVLPQSLTPSIVGMKRIVAIDNEFAPDEREIIISTLEVLTYRNDESKLLAQQALDEYWC
ncbi:MAG: hypothetical protein KDC26_06310 [Armatimonadetes bacterium]|nr:hypothetical protein [Armatimonadota bacterium]